MISTHILDTTAGLPASQVTVHLEKRNAANEWKEVARDKTNANGRVVFSVASEAGNYRLTFDIEDYYTKRRQEHFFMNVPVAFKITDTSRKYHVPLLLNPFGHSTYRGS